VASRRSACASSAWPSTARRSPSLALAEAIVLARALDARVRLVGVAHATELFPDPAWLGLGDRRYANALHERRRHELDRGSATVPEPLRASSALVIGEPAHAPRG
jgi:hypothetical protein